MSKWIGVFLILFLSISSCARKEEQNSIEQNSLEHASAGASESSKEKTDVKSNKAITLKKDAERKQSTHESSSPDFLPIHSNTILPDDFKIGALQDIQDEIGDEQKIISAVRSFLELLCSGEINSEYLIPVKKEELSRFLNHHIKQNLIIRSFRIGIITIQENTAWMNIRLFSDIGITEGELYLSYDNRKWYISDIQIAFE